MDDSKETETTVLKENLLREQGYPLEWVTAARDTFLPLEIKSSRIEEALRK